MRHMNAKTNLISKATTGFEFAEKEPDVKPQFSALIQEVSMIPIQSSYVTFVISVILL